MTDIIKSEIKTLRSDIPKISQLSDEFLFSLVCYKYFYNDGRLNYSDCRDCYVDGRSDGGVDVIAVDEDDQQPHLVLIQSKLIPKIGNKQDVVDIFTKMDQTCRDFDDYRTGQYNDRLKRIFKEKR